MYSREKDLICYCFGYSESDIVDDILKNNGSSSVLERILSEKKKGACNCRSNHPDGR